jgi:hypothetical protein
MRESLRVPVLVAVVLVIAGGRLSGELLDRAVGTRLFDHYSLWLVLGGVVSIAVGLVAMFVCRRLAVAGGVQPRAALGAGLAIGSLPIARGIDHLIDAGFWTVFTIGDLPPSLVLDILDLVTAAVVAVCVFTGLRMVGAASRSAVLVVVGLAALVTAANQLLDPGGSDFEHLRRILELRYWAVTIGVPALVAVGVLVLARRPAEEPIPA